MTQLNKLRLTTGLNVWIVGIAVGLIALHLTLAMKANNLELLSTSLVFWAAVSSLVWEKHDKLSTESGVFSSFLGATLLASVLIKSALVSGNDIFLRISPFISAFGLALVVSGAKGLKQYWQELLLLGFISIPQGVVQKFADLTLFTAQFSNFLLWCLGFPVIRQGVFITLPPAKVVVAEGCSGINSMLQLLGLALLFIFMFPETNRKQKIYIPILALLVAFFVNGIRVAMLTLLVAHSNPAAFDYWHTGTGSQIFPLIGVVILGLFCWFFILRKPPNNHLKPDV
jgi:cyanoexosortase A